MLSPTELTELKWIVDVRRALHQYPELSWQEKQTAQVIAQSLENLGIAPRFVGGGTGIVADIPGKNEGPYIALRADTDALAVHEETGLPFASQCHGVMHACGHDGHTAMLLGAAQLLKAEKELLYPVRLLFQPAEETGAGALKLIEEGHLDSVAMIFGGHLDRHYRCGTVIISDGYMNASTDQFEIRISGQSAHAARPHESIDAVVVGSLLVMSLQTIVSREMNPAHPSVVTIGRFDAGTAHNVIAGQARLEGTIRAQEPSVREHLKLSLRRMVSSVAQLHNANIQICFSEGTPAVINQPEIADIARQAARSAVEAENVLPLEVTNMGGEDFSYYLEKVPGCYVRFGGQVQGKEGFPAHSSKFDFDEGALFVGAQYYHQVALRAAEALEKQLN